MALGERSFSKQTHWHHSQSLSLPCGCGLAVMSATNSFPALVDGPEVGEVIRMRSGESSASLPQLRPSRLRRP